MSTPTPSQPLEKRTTLADLLWDGSMLRVRFAGPSVGQREAPLIGDDLNEFLAAAGDRLRFMVLDLSGVTFMSSMGLGVCIAARNEAARRKAAALLTGLRPELQKVFKMMKIDQMYRICPTEADLRKAMGR